MAEDYYCVLGVARGADLDRIKQAYRTKVRKHHPDATHVPADSERFLEIQEAYDTLSDAKKRASYDRKLNHQGSSMEAARAPRGPGRLRPGRAPAWDVDDFVAWPDELFGGSLASFFGAREPRRGDLHLEVILSPEEASRGARIPLDIPVYEECPRCRGTGVWAGFSCGSCGGSGMTASRRRISLDLPRGVRHGSEEVVPLDSVGLPGTRLHLTLAVDPYA